MTVYSLRAVEPTVPVTASPGVQPDPDDRRLDLAAVAHRLDAIHDLEPGRHGVPTSAVVSDRRPEDRHEAVAEELVHDPVVLLTDSNIAENSVFRYSTTSFGRRCSANAVNPWMSTNTTQTWRTSPLSSTSWRSSCSTTAGDVLTEHAHHPLAILDRPERRGELAPDLEADHPGQQAAADQEDDLRALPQRIANARIGRDGLGLAEEVDGQPEVFDGGHQAGEHAEPEVQAQRREDDEDEVAPGHGDRHQVGRCSSGCPDQRQRWDTRLDEGVGVAEPDRWPKPKPKHSIRDEQGDQLVGERQPPDDGHHQIVKWSDRRALDGRGDEQPDKGPV